jgi:hypothetical protein
LIVAVALAVAITSFVMVRASGQESSPPPETGLSDDERHSLHATAVAQTASQIKTDRSEFARLGLSLDALARGEIQSFSAVETLDAGTAVKASDAVVLVQSEGAYVDAATGELHLKLSVIEAIKGGPMDSLDIPLTGGPQKGTNGEWIPALAPYELYLAHGETAILLLTAKDSQNGSLRQRPFEAMLVRDGKIVPRDHFAFKATLADTPVDQARAQLSEAAQ